VFHHSASIKRVESNVLRSLQHLYQVTLSFETACCVVTEHQVAQLFVPHMTARPSSQTWMLSEGTFAAWITRLTPAGGRDGLKKGRLELKHMQPNDFVGDPTNFCDSCKRMIWATDREVFDATGNLVTVVTMP
jgi:hypothetical protein